MREIKFRAWDKDYKKMITNFLLPESKSFGMHRMAISFTGEVFTFTDWDMAEYDEDEMYNSAKYPSRFKIMQYTGLKDKNGKEIYEGDICNCREYECFGKAEWNNEEAGFYFCVVMEGGGFEEEHLYDYADELEVIGNIYENPELLGIHHED